MTNGQTGFLLLLVLSLILLSIGMFGTLGVFVAICFCPRYVTLVDDSGSNTNASSTNS
jgi:hypothetical protein